MAGKTGPDALRFLWLRTFHAPVAVRIVAYSDSKRRTKADSLRLHAVELSGAGGYEPGEVQRRLDSALGYDVWDTLAKLLANAEFWDAPSAVQSFGDDGAEWIFEVRIGDRYHVVSRWAPHEDGRHAQFWTLGQYLIALTGWDFGVVYD
jgi:hypothetical protein